MKKIIDIYLENLSNKAERLRIHRQTLYAWKRNPKQANLDLIEKDLRALLALIEEERGLRVKPIGEVITIDDTFYVVETESFGEIKLLHEYEFHEAIEVLLTTEQLESFIGNDENEPLR